MTTLLGLLTGGSVAVPRYLFLVPAGLPSPAAVPTHLPITLPELLNLLAPPVFLVIIDAYIIHAASTSALYPFQFNLPI